MRKVVITKHCGSKELIQTQLEKNINPLAIFDCVSLSEAYGSVMA